MHLRLLSTVTLSAIVALLLPALVSAQNTWLESQPTQDQLAAGKVVARTVLDGEHSRGSVDAAIRIRAVPQTIWDLITHCESAAVFIPGLKRCQQLQTAADGSWAVIEHDIKYSPLLPMVHSVFRADYQPPYRMDFRRIGGDLKDEVGSWVLTPSSDGTVTTVEYRVSVQPGFWVPRAFLRRSLSKQLPAALAALRTRAEQPLAAHLASPAPAG